MLVCDVELKEGKVYIINEPVLGNITVTITYLKNNVVMYENILLPFQGACHIEHFKKMLVK